MQFIIYVCLIHEHIGKNNALKICLLTVYVVLSVCC